jgi:hypothetical protein
MDDVAHNEVACAFRMRWHTLCRQSAASTKTESELQANMPVTTPRTISAKAALALSSTRAIGMTEATSSIGIGPAGIG